MSSPAFCGQHQVFIFQRKGINVIGELPAATAINWNRVRDQISEASVTVPVNECCDILRLVETVRCELHIYRDGAPVWEGVITRIEYEYDQVQLFAEDMLWVAKRRALRVGYNYQTPGQGLPPGPVYGYGPISSIEHGRLLLAEWCYNDFDQWNMLNHLHPIVGPSDPTSSRQANAWSTTIWDEFDKLAEDHGIDYSMVGRELYWFDHHLKWHVVQPLSNDDLADPPRIVEYGNAFATRYFRTDGSGYAGMAEVPVDDRNRYGHMIDIVSNETSQAATDALPDPDSPPPPPSPAKLAKWTKIAEEHLLDLNPPRVAIVLPANSTLMPSSPWDVNTLPAGALFQFTLDHPCRGAVTDWQQIDSINVEETGEGGESITFTASSAAARLVEPL
jgi:hypothetical protein